MGELWAAHWSYGRDPKLEIVKGNVYSANQIYMAQSRSPGIRPRVSKVRKSSTKSKWKSWSFNDPEMKRRKRVAKYKAYAFEGKFKASFRKGFRWIKDKCSQMVHGF